MLFLSVLLVASMLVPAAAFLPGSAAHPAASSHGRVASLVPSANTTTVSLSLSGAAASPLSPGLLGVDVRADSHFQATQMAALNATPVRYVVWPGGAIADRLNMSADKLYSNSGSVSKPATSEAQFVAWCRSVQCQAILQVPAEIDQPSVGAEQIQYTEQTLGFTPAYIEIGNEPALWTHFGTPWSNWSSGSSGNATPSEYASVVHAYIAAIRAVDPSAHFLGLPGVGNGVAGEGAWLSATLKLNAPNLTAVAIHVYPGGSSSPSSPTLSGFFASLTGKASLPVRVPKDRSAMGSACANCSSMPILVTELGASATSTSYAPYMAGFPDVVYIGTELIQGMSLNLSSLDDFAFQNSYPGSWFATNGTQEPIYTLYQSLLPELGSAFVPVTASPSPGGLSVALTSDPSNGASTLFVANANLSQTFHLDLSALGLPAGSARVTWWNSTAPAPVDRSETSVPSSILVAPESVAFLEATGSSGGSGGGNGTLHGTVASAASGAPIGGANVTVSGASGGRSTTTDSAGAYSFTLPAGSYAVRVRASGYLAASENTSFSAGGTTTLDFALSAPAAATYAVTGVVVGAGGAPLARANVSVLSSLGTVGTTTAANGSFSVRLANGTFSLTATAPGYGSATLNGSVAGSALALPDVQLTPLSTAGRYAVSGYIVDAASGGPVASAELFISNATTTLREPVASAGHWSVELANGTYTVTATAPGYGSNSTALVVAGAPAGPLLLALPEAPTVTSTAPPSPLPPTAGMLLPFLPSAAVGAAGFLSWRRFLRAPRQLAGRPGGRAA